MSAEVDGLKRKLMNKLAPEAAALKTDWEVFQRPPVMSEAVLSHMGLPLSIEEGLRFFSTHALCLVLKQGHRRPA